MSILRKLLVTKVKHAIDLSSQYGDLEHAGMTGRLRELVVTELIEPLLPNDVAVTTGKLIDSKGNKSSQLDIIIYSPDILPPITQLKEQSLIPVEAALQVIEVKSKLNAEEMKTSIEKADSVKSLYLILQKELKPPLSFFVKREVPFVVSPIFSIFAFGTDLKKKNDWERYVEIKNDPKGVNSLLVNDICVVGSGYWNGMEGEVITEEATEDYNEVLRMLIFLVNSIPIWKRLRGTPQFGHYFADTD